MDDDVDLGFGGRVAGVWGREEGCWVGGRGIGAGRREA